MTDAEIKKALECCSKSGRLNDCDGCPCYDEKEDIQTSECQERIMKNALDLINRQQAEIDRLKYNLEAVLAERADHAEAIKEFAERVKTAFYYEFEELIPSIMAEKIDNLVKEMVGDTE